MNTFLFSSSDMTFRAGQALAKVLLSKKTLAKKGCVVALSGNLGAGKTTFISGVWSGLGLPRTTSPTFIIWRTYPPSPAMRRAGFKSAHHLDCYRVPNVAGLRKLGIDVLLNTPGVLVCVEWPQKARLLLPPQTIYIRFKHNRKDNLRSVVIGGTIYQDSILQAFAESGASAKT